MTEPAPETGRLTMADLVADPRLRAYLGNVRDWHGYVRFLGLPDRRDNPDVAIDSLFVEPLLTRRHVSPDENPAEWLEEAETVFAALVVGRPLVLLGDPGSGKSTLLNYLAWLLARPTGDIWAKQVGRWLLPVPIVLRELRLRGVRTFPGLMEAFLRHAMCEPLRSSDYLHEALAQGGAFILLDGVDELGDRKARTDLQAAVFDGFTRYPLCRWMLTSRIVGYDEVPFDGEVRAVESAGHSRESSADREKGGGKAPSDTKKCAGTRIRQDERKVAGTKGAVVQTRYVAPFDDRRIDAFAKNWYVQREAAATRAGADASHLVQAVHADDAILRLARVPNLLTMMALIHRVEATLPHGRALLYGRIAEAYLESIDKFRGVYSGAYNLVQKTRWLGRIGYEMQRRRSKRATASSKGNDEAAGVLVDASTVVDWLREEMRRDGVAGGLSPGEFLDYVGRRSGLFLPRGEGRYAFVHLSFQEYFAAVALEREVTGLNWARGRPTPLGVGRDEMGERAGEGLWRETFAFLFELLATREEWHADFLEAVFGENFSAMKREEGDEERTLKRAELLSRLSVDRRSGIKGEMQGRAIEVVVDVALEYQEVKRFGGPRVAPVFQELLGDDSEWNEGILTVVGKRLEHVGCDELTLAGTRVEKLGPIGAMVGLRMLNLTDTRVKDLGPLSELRKLESLLLWNAPVEDLGPLRAMEKLTVLDVMGSKVTDLAGLENLNALEILDARNTGVSELAALGGARALQILFLSGTEVTDLEPLRELTAMRTLDLRGTRVSDLRPLRQLKRLRRLELSVTKVWDLSPLGGLRELRHLDLDGVAVLSLEPLRAHRKLESLYVNGGEVTDLRPLAGLMGLRSLALSETAVSDIGPLSELVGLRELDLSGTGTSDVGPLAGLVSLESLDLSETLVEEVEALRGLSGLRRLNLRGTGISVHVMTRLRAELKECVVVS